MKNNEMKMSIQAAKSIMLILQKGLLEQCDISQLILDLKFENTVDGLCVTNPPAIKFEFDNKDGLPLN